MPHGRRAAGRAAAQAREKPHPRPRSRPEPRPRRASAIPGRSRPRSAFGRLERLRRDDSSSDANPERLAGLQHATKRIRDCIAKASGHGESHGAAQSVAAHPALGSVGVPHPHAELRRIAVERLHRDHAVAADAEVPIRESDRERAAVEGRRVLFGEEDVVVAETVDAAKRDRSRLRLRAARGGDLDDRHGLGDGVATLGARHRHAADATARSCRVRAFRRARAAPTPHRRPATPAASRLPRARRGEAAPRRPP